jgi:hypothetical protein
MVRGRRGLPGVLVVGVVTALMLVVVPLSAASAATVSGTLHSAAGEPVANASVSFYGGFAETTTAPDGSFSLAAPAGECFLEIDSTGPNPGLPPSWRFFGPASDCSADRDLGEIDLPATSTLTVEVLDDEGAAIPGTRVVSPEMEPPPVEFEGGSLAQVRSLPEAVTTDGNGRASFTVFAGSFRALHSHGWVEPPAGSGYAFTSFGVPAMEGDTTVVVHAVHAVHLSGTLRDAGGEPVSGASMVLGGSPAGVETTTAADGSFSIEGAPDGHYLSISGHGLPGLPPRWKLNTEWFQFTSDLERDVVLPPTSTLTVEVLNAKGAPIPGTAVTVPNMRADGIGMGEFVGREIESEDLSGIAGEDGRVSFKVFTGSSPYSGQGVVEPPLESGYPATKFETPTVTGDTTVVVHSALSAQLSGTLRNAAGEPVAHASVSLYGGLSSAETTTAPDGSFSLTASPGEYELLIQSTGPDPGLPPSWRFAAEVLDFRADLNTEITLPETAALTVEVLDPIGAAVPGATVTLPEMHSPPLEFAGLPAAGAWSLEATGTTDENGRVTFRVFEGSFRQSHSHGSVEPPAGSGFASSTFLPPTVAGDTTISVSLAELEDAEAPRLDELAIEPAEIDVGSSPAIVYAIGHISDDLSGFKEGRILFTSPNGEVNNSGSFELVSGGPNAGTYHAEVPFEQFSEAGGWRASVVLEDAAGNQRKIGPEELKEAGFASGVQVQSTPEPPVVTAIEPATGSESGGTVVQISGSGLEAASAVRFGSSAASEFSVSSPGTIVAVAPPGSGTVDVTVTTPGGTSATSSADRFRYAPPVTLTSASNPSVHGQKVTFTAKVVPLAKGVPAPLGTIAFVEGTTTLGVVNLSKGSATFNTTALGAGEHTVIAQYSGDANFAPGQSEPLTQVVAKATTQVTLASSLNPAPYGSTATLKATVKAVAPGAGTPAGTVTFTEGEAVLGTVQLAGVNATLSLKTLPPGAHEITAAYSGDANDEPNEAGPVAQTILQATTETSLTSTLNPAPYGSSASLKATVKAVAPGGGTPQGTVSFREGETVLATVPLVSGSAKYPLKSLSPGTHEITATYSGNANYAGSEAAIAQAVSKAATELTLTSSKNPAPKGSSGTLRATVKALSPGGGTPVGTVTYREGEVVLATIPIAGNAATYPLKSLPAGTHEITATYSGSANYEASEDSITQAISP